MSEFNHYHIPTVSPRSLIRKTMWTHIHNSILTAGTEQGYILEGFLDWTTDVKLDGRQHYLSDHIPPLLQTSQWFLHCPETITYPPYSTQGLE